MPNIVYVLTNPAMPGIVKIGMTDRDVQSRMKQLYDTGVPLPFECVIAREMETREAADIESALHTAFGPYRINPSREFFEIDPEQARVILQVMPGRDATPDVIREAASVEPEDREAATKFKKRQSRVNEQGFLESLDDNGRQVYGRVLSLGKQEGMRVTWGVTGFSLGVACNRETVVICYGYPLNRDGLLPSASPAFNQAIYTDFSMVMRKTCIPEDDINALRQRALDTGLFVSVGQRKEIRCTIARQMIEAELDSLMDWLLEVVELIREYEGKDGTNGENQSQVESHQDSEGEL